MILRVVAITLLLVAAAVLQTALFPSLTLMGFRPDLLLLVVLAVALRDGPFAGARVGAAAGLLADLLIAQAPVGLAMLVYAVIGHAVGLARPYLAPDSITAPLLLAFVSGLVGTAGYGILGSLLGDDRVTPALLVQASVAVALYNTLLAPVALGVVRRLGDRFPVGRAAAVD